VMGTPSCRPQARLQALGPVRSDCPPAACQGRSEVQRSLSQPRRLAPRTSRVTWPNSAAIFSAAHRKPRVHRVRTPDRQPPWIREEPPTAHLDRCFRCWWSARNRRARRPLVRRGGLYRPGVGAVRRQGQMRQECQSADTCETDSAQHDALLGVRTWRYAQIRMRRAHLN
jgi:hypothetical protein